MTRTGMEGRVALVTGANHGIGAATARALAAAGAAVFLSYLRGPLYEAEEPPAEEDQLAAPGPALYRARQAQTAESVLRTIREAGGQAEAWEADLADPAAIPALFEQAEAALGPVDILVNNAAYCQMDTFLPPGRREARAFDQMPRTTITAESHDRHFAVNSRAVALMMAELARRVIERGAAWGRIINVSTDGASGFSGEISYGASKHAMESYSRAAASELGPYGIAVNVVSLGPIQTGWIPPQAEREWPAGIPLRRIGQPEDVADVIVFLASEQARWITGQLIYVGGGHQMPL
jgi:3-oxoacyl-[acyl-carrier protein] reductase